MHSETTWFYDALGIDEGYFKLESVDTVADHIEVRLRKGPARPIRTLTRDATVQSLYGAKVQAHAAHQDYLEIKLEKESEVRGAPISLSPLAPSGIRGRRMAHVLVLTTFLVHPRRRTAPCSSLRPHQGAFCSLSPVSALCRTSPLLQSFAHGRAAIRAADRHQVSRDRKSVV